MITMDIDWIQATISELNTYKNEFDLLGENDKSKAMDIAIEALEERIRLLQLCEYMCEYEIEGEED